MRERWEPVVGWERFYEVSDQGHVRSLRASRGWRVRPRVLKLTQRPTGHLYVTLSAAGIRSKQSVHRLVLLAFSPPNVTDGPLVCHRNDVPWDNRVENLYWGTPKTNKEDEDRNGRLRKGVAHPNSRLTESGVLRIRSAAKDGCSFADLGSEYAVHPSTIRQIVTRRTWKHVEEESWQSQEQSGETS